jgi:ADP-ribose pyrophosphatase YjhB (NUDIX family)
MHSFAKAPHRAGPSLSVLAVVARVWVAGPRVLLVRRANPPQPGHWGFPGGKVEWGEDFGGAAIRELKEETGIEGANPVAFDAIDLILPDLTDAHSGTAYHHLMIAVRLDWQAGEPVASDDALEARWAAVAALPQPLCADVAQVAAAALALPR